MSEHYAKFRTFLEREVLIPFQEKRLTKLEKLTLSFVLGRKNPYLFKIKNIESPKDLAKDIVDAYLSSREETVLGNLLESFAIYVAETLYKGFKSNRKSLDLEFERDENYFIVGIKSGTSWGNADQISALKSNFKAAKIALRSEGIKKQIIAVNGCIYGRDNSPLKTDPGDDDQSYFKYAGQEFWKFLSNDDNLHREIINLLDSEIKTKSPEFQMAYEAKIEELAKGIFLNFDDKGKIDWPKMIDFVSATKRTTLKRVPSSKSVIEKAKKETKK